jgi:predicted RecB family nuclease
MECENRLAIGSGFEGLRDRCAARCATSSNEAIMRLIASDFITNYRPSRCDLRVFLKQRGEKESEAGPYDEVLQRLGIIHEKKHLQTLGPYTDLSDLRPDEGIKKTTEAIARKVPVLYQPAFLVKCKLGGGDVEIVGLPDFLIFDGGSYLVRDSKISRRIDEKNHPEILLQLQLYGWLFERSCGNPPKGLQVYNGTGEIVDVPYNGGVPALGALERLIAIKQLNDEFYEPVGWSKCLGCGFNERCWTKAEANADVAAVPYVDQSLARTLHELGQFSRKELLAKFDVKTLGELKRPVGKGQQKVGKWSERIIPFAEALEKNEERVLAMPAIPYFENYVMFDLEGLPPHLDDSEKIYLWGIQVFGAKPSKFMPAVSGFGPNGDKEGWLAFLANAVKIFKTYGDIPFLHWAAYEKTHIDQYLVRYGDVDGVAARIRVNLLDLLKVATDSLVLPVPSFGLKVIEKYIGFKRKQKEYGGQWAMAKFIEATETNDEEKRNQLMDEILLYNQEDLAATWAVFEWLRGKVPGVANPAKAN